MIRIDSHIARITYEHLAQLTEALELACVIETICTPAGTNTPAARLAAILAKHIQTVLGELSEGITIPVNASLTEG